MPRARDIGLIGDEAWARFEGRRSRHERNRRTLDSVLVRSERGDRLPASAALRQPAIRLDDLVADGRVSLDLDTHTRDLDIASLENDVKYAGYLKQEAARVERVRRQERRAIPGGFPFGNIPGLSREVIHRLTQVQPETLGQASRIPGVTPAAVAVLGAYLSRPIEGSDPTPTPLRSR
jgi:tRNA uridine 5-carboxymethylaminomethyl modification enzyme